MADIWIGSIMTIVLGPAAFYLFRLHELADGLRKAISETTIWDPSSFPLSIGHIEANSSWRLAVRGFYHDAESMLSMVPAYFGITILIVAAMVGVYGLHDELAVVEMRGVTLLRFIQIVIVCFACVWALRVLFIVNGQSRRKGELEALIKGLKK